MGAGAYQRGSAAIARQITDDYNKSPHYLSRLEQTIENQKEDLDFLRVQLSTLSAQYKAYTEETRLKVQQLESELAIAKAEAERFKAIAEELKEVGTKLYHKWMKVSSYFRMGVSKQFWETTKQQARYYEPEIFLEAEENKTPREIYAAWYRSRKP